MIWFDTGETTWLELMLLRHAKSDWPEGVADVNRPLKKRGKKAALRTGEWLLEQQLCPDWIVSSPAQRASETAEKVCKGLKLKKRQVLHFDDRNDEWHGSCLKKCWPAVRRFLSAYCWWATIPAWKTCY